MTNEVITQFPIPAQNISQFPSATPIVGSELIPVMQNGITSQSTAAAITLSNTTSISSLTSITTANSNAIIALQHASSGGIYSTTLAPSNDASGNTDTTNLIAAYNLAISNPVLVPGNADYSGYGVISFLPGIYYINQSYAMMNASLTTLKMAGMIYRGAGSDVTVLVYTPSASGPLLQNQTFLNVQFYGFTFRGNDVTGNSDFMQSQEQPLSNVQYFNYYDCAWTGVWRNIATLTGTNNNSEWAFDRCYVTTSNLQNWIYTPANSTATITALNSVIAVNNSLGGLDKGSVVNFLTTTGNITAGVSYYVVYSTTTSIEIASVQGGSPIIPNLSGTPTINSAVDQFLNFWFIKCKFWSVIGSWMTMNYGGSVKIYQCDVSGWTPTVTTYLFNLLGSSHAYGVCFFLADGLRVEHKSDVALLMHTQWNQGAICFALLDQASQVQSRNPANVYFWNDCSNVAGPNIEFRQCQLIGNHQYTTNSTNYEYQTKAIYRNCDLLQNTSAAACIIWQNLSNSGGAPGIRFEDCRSSENLGVTGYKTVFDSDLFWNQGMGSITQTKTVNVCNAFSQLPFNGASVQFLFPQNCALIRLRFYKVSGGNGGTYSYNVQSTDVVPVVYGNFTGANAAIAIYQTLDIFVPLTTSTLWTLTVTDAQNRGTSIVGNIYIDYIG
jgi:hypothetical protein